MSELRTQSSFDPTDYWQERLSADYSLGSTGWKTLGEAFNKWSYAVRGRVFTRVARDALPTRDHASVLDMGSGTGFYLDLWQRLGAARFTGSDLTPVAVERLTRRYPTATIQRVDIGGGAPPLPVGAYDAISIIDVLYHIVDDARYVQALFNLASLLKPDGVLLMSENLVSRPSRAAHQVTRSREWLLSALGDAGLAVVHEQPIFFLMNTPVSSDNRLLHRWWRPDHEGRPPARAHRMDDRRRAVSDRARLGPSRSRPSLPVDDAASCAGGGQASAGLGSPEGGSLPLSGAPRRSSCRCSRPPTPAGRYRRWPAPGSICSSPFLTARTRGSVRCVAHGADGGATCGGTSGSSPRRSWLATSAAFGRRRRACSAHARIRTGLGGSSGPVTACSRPTTGLRHSTRCASAAPTRTSPTRAPFRRCWLGSIAD